MRKIVLTLANVGSATKSTCLLELLAAAEKKGVQVAKFDFDADHKTLHSAYAERDEDGDPLAEQDPIKGCPLIDIDKDPEMILRIAKTDAAFVVADLPARAIHEIFTALGERTGVADLYNSYFDKGIMACHIIPLVDSTKSLQTLEAIYTAITTAEIDEDAQIELIVVKNIGYMDSFGVNYTNNALAEYERSNIVAAIRNNPRFILKEVEFKTQLNTFAKEAITPTSGDGKANKLLDILATPELDWDIETLINNMVRDGTKLLKAIQS